MISAIILLSLSGMALGMHLAKNGEPRTDKYSFFAKLAATAIELWLLYNTGFFNVFN
jgi:hypothetical protein